jgi:putative DNA primase/helicase
MVPETIMQLAASGAQLFPLAARSKAPAVRWQDQASSDAAKLQQLAAQFPACNWGMVTGARSGIWVLDLDGLEGAEWFARMLAEHDWPDTRTTRTKDGTHLYYACVSERSAAIRCSAGKIAPGVDVRGEGGYVVVPPSTHPEGPQYQWITAPNHPIAEAPSWLEQLALDANNHDNNTKPSLSLAEIIPEGRRNATLTSFAGSMRAKGLSAEAIAAALMVENHERC